MLNAKHLSCIDEEFFVELATPIKEARTASFIIAVSYTRTYLVTNHTELSRSIQATEDNAEKLDKLTVL